MTATPLVLSTSDGDKHLMLTSVGQVNGHLREYSWRLLTVESEGGTHRTIRERKAPLYRCCDRLLDAGLMLRAEAMWARVQCWDLDATEIGGQPSVEPSEEVAAA